MVSAAPPAMFCMPTSWRAVTATSPEAAVTLAPSAIKALTVFGSLVAGEP